MKAPADGGFTKSNCTVASPTHTGKYEWQGGVEKAGFTTTGGTFKLETPSKARVTCTAENGTGQITSSATVRAVVMIFSGCESEGAKCTTAGQAEGVLQSKTLEGALGWQQKAAQEVALDIYPAGHTGPFMEYSCGDNAAVLTGSVLVPLKANKMAQALKLEYKASKGKQDPEAFEGAPADVLKNSLGEQVGLGFTATQTNEERSRSTRLSEVHAPAAGSPAPRRVPVQRPAAEPPPNRHGSLRLTLGRCPTLRRKPLVGIHYVNARPPITAVVPVLACHLITCSFWN